MFKTIFSIRINTKSLLKPFRFFSFDSVSQKVTPNFDNQFIQIKNPLLKLNSVDSIPTINELSDVIRNHATKVYSGTRIEFDSNRQHDQTVGTQHCIIPLASKKERYLISSSKNKRAFVLSVIFEETDILATYIGYKHNQNPKVPIGTPDHHTIGIVTASIDRIDFAPNAHFRDDQDILLTGFVSWVGKSSMEIIITARQKDVGGFRDLLIFKFLMVSVNHEFKSAPNVPLIIRTEEEKQMFKEAEDAKNARELKNKNSIFAVGPTQDEFNHIKQLTNKIIDPLTLSDRNAKLPNDFVWMSDATAKSEAMCYPIQTNLHGYIFGGYSITEAYNIAWINAARFAKKEPKCIGMTNLTFPLPVAVNSILYQNSQICYTEGEFAQLAVDTSIIDKKTKKHLTTNTFHFTFDVEGANLPKIMPRTYSDCLRYLNSKREFDYALKKT